MLSSSQQFVYGTLFAKLIFPPFKWDPASERGRERERGREGEKEREGGRERARKSVKVKAGSCSSWTGERKGSVLREVSGFVNDFFFVRLFCLSP